VQVALVGKGVTFDSGGYNLKVQGGIETMKCDMVRDAVDGLVVLFVHLRRFAIETNLQEGSCWMNRSVGTYTPRQTLCAAAMVPHNRDISHPWLGSATATYTVLVASKDAVAVCWSA
jgi:hypothetical protein